MESVDREWFALESQRQQEEAKRRRALYLQGRQTVIVEGKIAIIVDDGLATGLTMFLAVKEARHRHPKKIVVAVPVGPADTVEKLRSLVDAVEVLHIPDMLGAIGAFYRDFDQVSDAEVVQIMKCQTLSLAALVHNPGQRCDDECNNGTAPRNALQKLQAG